MTLQLLERRTITKDLGHRTIEIPVDSMGRERLRAALVSESVEVRAAGEDGSIGFRGHAAVFNKRTQIGSKRYGFAEQVDPAAFNKTIQEADVRLLQNHDPNLLLARNKAGTLRLAVDKVGLDTDADMAPVSYAQDLAVLLERKDISQMSFAFETVADRWETLDDGSELRTLLEVKLWDVSIVTYPAYEETDAGLRSAAFDVLCRSAGLSDDDRARLLRGLTADELDPDSIALLRAAGVALADLKALGTDDTTPPAGRSLALASRHMDAMGVMFGLDNKAA